MTQTMLTPRKIEWLEECGCCGAYHRAEFDGDCRQDDERFPFPYLPYEEIRL